MSKRPPNELESRLHQAASSNPKQVLILPFPTSTLTEGGAGTDYEIKPNQLYQIRKARQNALNFLLAVGLFKPLKDAKGNVSFRAVSKSELVATKDLSGEENLVLSHIKNSSTEGSFLVKCYGTQHIGALALIPAGIWTKHLKAKTNLHQTVIDRCLKTLIQKRLIKRVPSVQHPTRKIYMLEGLEPSVALTGGPWYTDNELDTEFIQHLMDACYKFIYDMSFPKRRDAPEGALYPISNQPEYPSAQSIRNSLRKARLTETDLSVEHVESLLNVLVLDGRIEALPSFGANLWDATAINDESESEDEKRSRKKRKHDSDDSADEKKRSKRKRKKSSRGSSDEDSEDEESISKKKKSRRKRDPSPESGSEPEGRKRLRKARRKRRSDSEDENRSRRSSKKSKRSPSPFDPMTFDSFDSGSGLVYRALKEHNPPLGWTQAPCALCPSFEFCKPGGPVNPHECVYYDDWLTSKTMAAETAMDL
ncbi:hypothetical protein NMY22_g5611 [Coprinellus aureogranulatus]|nr:hypothetical protein NMY22_g5611 [Coprinellus aureogranulatus]